MKIELELDESLEGNKIPQTDCLPELEFNWNEIFKVEQEDICTPTTMFLPRLDDSHNFNNPMSPQNNNDLENFVFSKTFSTEAVGSLIDSSEDDASVRYEAKKMRNKTSSRRIVPALEVDPVELFLSKK
jgi:hypothetical protein